MKISKQSFKLLLVFIQSEIQDNFLLRIIFIYSLLIILSMFFVDITFTATDLNAWKSDYENLLTGSNAISKFPPAYLFNSMLLYFGYKTLYINVLFIMLPIIIILSSQKLNKLYIVYVYVLVIILTPIVPFYLNSGALEVQAGITIGIFLHLMFKVISNDKLSLFEMILLVITSILFNLYKDINLIIVFFALSFTIIHLKFFKLQVMNILDFIKLNFFQHINYQLLLIIFTLFFSIALSLAYNFIRYKTFIPIMYINEAQDTSPTILKTVEFFFFSIFSPNGGVLSFWTLSFVCMYLFIKKNLDKKVIIFSIYYVLISLAGLSKWWAPFGWDSFGNRLIIPSMLGIIVFLILSAKLDLKKKITSKYSYKSFIVFFLVVIYPIYYITSSYWMEREKLFTNSLFGGPKCLIMIEKLQSSEGERLGLKFWKSSYYYECATERFLFYPNKKYTEEVREKNDI